MVGIASQALVRARDKAGDGKLLAFGEGVGPYDDKFWTRVAQATPGRTQEECLDAYIAQRRNPVARFSASGRKLSLLGDNVL